LTHAWCVYVYNILTRNKHLGYQFMKTGKKKKTLPASGCAIIENSRLIT